MRRFKLTVAYDGTAYCGWQIQPNGITVQEKLNIACSSLFGTEIRTIGASRTDAGVHARGQVAVFDAETRMPADKVAYALNTHLPDDIRIQHSCEVSPDFHPRFAETRKTYEYRILHRTFDDPTRNRNAIHVYGVLDLAEMQKACTYLIGEHDFACFQASGSDDSVRSTVRRIFSAELTEEDELIRFRIEGDGFLYHMVRIIAGTLIEIGQGRRQAEEMQTIIASKKRECAGPTAPAKGLTLLRIVYP